MKSIWKHKKYKNREYVSSYKIYGRERAFVLNYKTKKKKHRVTFESYQLAKQAGWVRQ